MDAPMRRSLDWEHPSGTEVAVTASFISRQGGQIHHGLGGSSPVDIARRQYGTFRPYLQLEETLNVFIPNVLGIQRRDSDSWDDLSERIGRMEKQFKGVKKGLWLSLWYKMGRNQETVDAWAALIPDTYGLGVVRAGLALVFKLAEFSAYKRQIIFDAFAALRDTLIQAHPERRSFRANQKLNDNADRLYQSVVDAIQDLAVWLTSESKSSWGKVTSRLKRRNDTEPIGPEEILQKLQEHTNDFRDTLGLARNQAIEGTEFLSRANSVATIMVHNEVVAIRDDMQGIRHNTDELKAGADAYTRTVEKLGDQVTNRIERVGGKINDRVSHLSIDISRLDKKLDEHAATHDRKHDEHTQHCQDMRDLLLKRFDELKHLVEQERKSAAAERRRRIARRETDIQENQQVSRTLLLNLLVDRKEMEAQIVHLENQLQPPAPTPIICLDHFLRIIARPSHSSRSGASPSANPIRLALQHPTKDLALALAEQYNSTTNTLSAQSQVQSLLTEPQFHDWLNTPYPAILFVDANLPAAATAPLSATSLFCATFVTSLMQVYPTHTHDDHGEPTTVVIHFFAGLHSTPSDSWYGPAGLVRSLILQLVMRLADLDRHRHRDAGLDSAGWLGFVETRAYARALERHDLQALCQTLHLLLGEFPAGTTVFVVVDAVGSFDVDRVWEDWEFVAGCLGAVVEDEEGVGEAVAVKVLLVNQGTSTLRMRGLSVLDEGGEEGGLGRVVGLSEMGRDGMGINERMVEHRLRRARTPEVPGWEDGRSGRGKWEVDCGYEDDGYD